MDECKPLVGPRPHCLLTLHLHTTATAALHQSPDCSLVVHLCNNSAGAAACLLPPPPSRAGRIVLIPRSVRRRPCGPACLSDRRRAELVQPFKLALLKLASQAGAYIRPLFGST